VTTVTGRPRHQVRCSLDGDFELNDVLRTLPPPASGRPPARRPGAARAALEGRLWKLPTGTDPDAVLRAEPASRDGPVSAMDLDLLHRFETSRLWLPPVAGSTAGLTPLVASAWLTIAEHWLALYASSGDLRFLNATCKVFGAVWTRLAPVSPAYGAWREPLLASRAAGTAAALAAATTELADRLDRRSVPEPGPDASAAGGPLDGAATRPSTRVPAVLVLAGIGSAGAHRFLRAAERTGRPVARVCWYGLVPARPVRRPESAYDRAWYPPDVAEPLGTTAGPTKGPDLAEVHTPDWEAVAAVLRATGPAAVILVGMPIVPAGILDLVPHGFVNAHNGALPAYRGMDAVGWALLNGDPVVCTAHVARAVVDTGEVLAQAPVQLAPLGALRRRVKDCQIRLLLEVVDQILAIGQVPAGIAQESMDGRLYYRMHPHLKRVLDASPYGQLS
jgi:hypothetical protein